MGKSASKLKQRKNSNSSNLTWPRFGSLVSLKSKFRQSQANVNESGKSRKSRKHLDINEWLKILDLEQYRDTFLNYHGVEELLEHTEADVKNLGIRIASHRARIMSSLTALRTKYYNNNGTLGRDNMTRHSVAADNRIKIQAVDTISDLKVVSDAIQSKSLNNLIMEPCMDPTMDAVALKKALEWELSLDARDLRSHAWYHGAIPRARAEDIVRDDGCFLIRDCTSQPGNYVLTCRTKQQALHFVINKIILQPDTVYERVQYQFEDDAFDTVPDLITYYVGSGKPITIASAARIQFPKNRLYPLSFYASKYPTPLCPSRMVSPATTPIVNMQMRCSPINPGLYKASPSPTRLSRETPPRLPSKKQRSHSLTPSEVNRVAQEKCNSADGVIQSPLMTRSVGSDVIISDSKFSTHSLPRNPCTRLSLSPSTIVLGRNSKNITRVTSDPSLSPCAERRLIASDDETNLPDSPPPKPSRIPSILRTESKESDYADTKHSLDAGFLQHGTLQRVTSYHASGSDSGNGSGDSALSSAAGDPIECNHRNSGVVIKNPRYNMTSSESTTTLKNYDFDYKEVEEKLLELPQPELNLISKFDLENFQTILLPVSENKPLDSQALKGIKLILKESGSRILANHLTKTDLDVVFGNNLENSHKKFGSGIELCLLPHGHQLRLDLIERTECLKLMVAITILTSPDEAERTETLNKWIEVAIDTKTALGNLFGFCGIMLGLCLPQVQRLDTTWHMLRQKYTDSAFNFEAKLRPTLKNMNNCSNPQAPNTTIPHLLPFVLLMERNLEDFLMPNDHQTFSCLNIWEINTQDFGLGTLLAHLESARKFLDSISIFQRNAEIVLGEARMEDLTLDMFKTEFQVKFLWGSRGAFATPVDRYNKFEQLLDVVADKYCNSISEQTEF